jgi:hypothetical protein
MCHRRRTLAAIGSGLIAAGSLACGSSKPSTAIQSTGKPAAPAAPTRSVPQPPVQRPAPLATTQTLLASSAPNRPKTTLTVKAARVISGLQPNSFQLAGSHKGLKFVGVQLTIVNTGRATWTGSPGKVSTLLTSSDTQAATITAAGNCGGAFSTKVELLPQERQRGCVPFVLKKGQRPRRFQFSPDAPATPPAEWSLRR